MHLKKKIIEFKRLTEIAKSEIIELMNNPLVRRQMPLLKSEFTERICEQFVITKEKLWVEYGYGPWAFIVNGRFAGWGGLQPENGYADLALVLHPAYWGLGKVLYNTIIDQAFGTMGFKTVTVLLPPSRKHINGLLRLGFRVDEELIVGDSRFIRYRLDKQSKDINTCS